MIEFATQIGQAIHEAAVKWAKAENRISDTTYYEPWPFREGEACGWDQGPTHIELFDPCGQYRIRRTATEVLAAVEDVLVMEEMTMLFHDEPSMDYFASKKEAQAAAAAGRVVVATLVPKEWHEDKDRRWSLRELCLSRAFGDRLLFPDGSLVKLLSRQF